MDVYTARICHVCVLLAVLELAYTFAPRSMVSLVMGLFWLTQGLGSFLGTGIITAFRDVWFFSDGDFGDINCKLNSDHVDISTLPRGSPNRTAVYQCHLDYYFFTLAAFQVVAIVVFILITFKLDIGGNDSKLPVTSNGSYTRSLPHLNDSSRANQNAGYSAIAGGYGSVDDVSIESESISIASNDDTLLSRPRPS